MLVRQPSLKFKESMSEVITEVWPLPAEGGMQTQGKRQQGENEPSSAIQTHYTGI